MTSSTWQTTLIWVLKANLVVWAINALIFGILVLSGSSFFGLIYSGLFSILALLETGLAFLVGGAIAFSGSVLTSKTKEYVRKSEENWSMEGLKKSEKKANKYIILAVILFAESLLISFLGV